MGSKDNIHITVKTPCAQSYQDFEQTSTGGFCDSCQRDVIDFTGFSSRELSVYFSKSTGKICGRLRPHQLGRLENYRQTSIGRKRVFAMTVGVLSVFFANGVKAQNRSVDSEVHHKLLPSEVVNKDAQVIAGDKRVLKGMLIDSQDQLGLPGASVYLKGSNLGTVTDLEGRFCLELDEDRMSSGVLVFAFIGFESKEIELSTLPKSEAFTLEMELNVDVLGEICVTKWSPRGLWYRFTRLIR
ncbi:hypothetical protein BFP72_08135 [Reichenbachiella sp. 5M10]|uniref:carboxypeptidase-like regulatory domain-containing protein n=1 Tax=Reichenbachiella sp. 5M10 TaxID=1889772 RepID=UPI000C150449|nr:carboxypeptidase-like regulatory domain-containing protein [Reichenbachiella sp. 5M10]PIB35365.1 hypothetical protein BFP72_08135 [Reichenbachiella sp. 5M10]